MAIKNPCAKERPVNNPYEVWKTPDGSWEWRVIKKWQVDDNKPFARWFYGVKSPYTHGSFELGDVYVSEIKKQAIKVSGGTGSATTVGFNVQKETMAWN